MEAHQSVLGCLHLPLWKSSVYIYLILSLELWRCNLLTCDQEFSLPGQSPPPRHCTARSPSVPDSSMKNGKKDGHLWCICILFHREMCLTWLSCVQISETFDTQSLCNKQSSTVYLWRKVSVKYALAVEVLQSSGNVQTEVYSHRPGQEHITVQQLLQVTAINVLQYTEVRPFFTGASSLELPDVKYEVRHFWAIRGYDELQK